MEPIIHTENINRIFKTGETEVHALKDVNIQVNQGELLILRGRSGSGKTTLMNILSALDALHPVRFLCRARRSPLCLRLIVMSCAVRR